MGLVSFISHLTYIQFMELVSFNSHLTYIQFMELVKQREYKVRKEI